MMYVFNPSRPLAQLETSTGHLSDGDAAVLSGPEVERALNEFGDCLIPVINETDDVLFLDYSDGENIPAEDEGVED